jgi:hypothetical protein
MPDIVARGVDGTAGNAGSAGNPGTPGLKGIDGQDHWDGDDHPGDGLPGGDGVGTASRDRAAQTAKTAAMVAMSQSRSVISSWAST